VTKAVLFLVFLLFASSAYATPSSKEESVRRFCAYVVGIPYASDNFSDQEYKRFLYCVDHLIEK
jgi:hypothetical protein